MASQAGPEKDFCRQKKAKRIRLIFSFPTMLTTQLLEKIVTRSMMISIKKGDKQNTKNAFRIQLFPVATTGQAKQAHEKEYRTRRYQACDGTRDE